MRRIHLISPRHVEYPIGATWRANEDGWTYEVTLEREIGRTHGKRDEVWWLSIWNGDISVLSDTFSSKQSAVRFAHQQYMNNPKTRFARVKEQSDGNEVS